jgi:hypothetical protein
VEGDERKKPLDLLSVVVCIHAPVGLLAQALLARITCIGRTVATGHGTVNSHVSCHNKL